MKIIRTVLGDIPADQIGATDAHDHLIRSGGPEIKLDPAFLMDDVEAAKKNLDVFWMPVEEPWFAWILSAAEEMFLKCWKLQRHTREKEIL